MKNNQEVGDSIFLLGEEENESNRPGDEANLPEAVRVSQVQGESKPCSSRMNSGQLELLIFLKNTGLDINVLCQQSRSLLASEKSVDELELPEEIVRQLIEYEKNNVVFREQNYQRSKNRAIYATLGLIITLSLFGIGLILIPAIVASIVIPFIPVFLLSVAITALARIFLKLHENYCHTEHRQAKKLLDDLKEIQLNLATNSAEQSPKEVLTNAKLSEEIQKISNNVNDLKKIVVQANSAPLMTSNGLFKKGTTSAEVSASNEKESACYSGMDKKGY